MDDETGARVVHGPAGTLVYGTTRDDRELIDGLKAAGFRWSARLCAWYLPRGWREPTRRHRARALVERMGGRVAFVESDEQVPSAAERESVARERAADRAERFRDRAARREATAGAAEAEAERVAAGIPMGQPVLVGHHSQARHERDLERIDAATRRSLDASRQAERARAGAERAERVAAGVESRVTVGNRLERNEAERRKFAREGVTGARADDLDDRIAHDRAKLDAMGGHEYSRDTVAPGDMVRVRGRWYPVVRANAKTVSVPNPVIPSRTRTTPWREVQAHRPACDLSGDLLRGMARAHAGAFPELAGMIEGMGDEREGAGA